MASVLQQWVQECSLREQGTLVLALRGPDGVPKEHGSKNVVRALRGCVMITGATGQPLMPGMNLPDDSFMEMYRVGHPKDGPWFEAVTAFVRGWDTYNVHFLFHLMHAAAICGYRYPDKTVRDRWWHFYSLCCDRVHVRPETVEEITGRLKDGHKPDEEISQAFARLGVTQ